MKTPHCQYSPAGRGRQAYTLVEVMLASSLFGLLICGVIYVQYFGIRYDQLVCSKLGASEMSRMSFDSLTADIRAAKLWMIGMGNKDSFSVVPNGNLQEGNALQLSLSANTNQFIRYFFTATNSGPVTNAMLCRMTNGSAQFQVMARNLTNDLFFRAETFRGDPVTDLQYKYVIRVVMQFCQFQYPLTKVGPGYYYDFYRMEFKVTPHCPDGA